MLVISQCSPESPAVSLLIHSSDNWGDRVRMCSLSWDNVWLYGCSECAWLWVESSGALWARGLKNKKKRGRDRKTGAFINSCLWDTTDLFMTKAHNCRHTHMLDSGLLVTQEIRGMPCELWELQCGRAKGRCYHTLRGSPVFYCIKHNDRACLLEAARWLWMRRPTERGMELEVNVRDIR